ncbi:hypothetical protein [Fluviicola sp.]|uniref:hypothetical protein n=1 Tax=Fluviicola sp. TaxID=1917219 RepID=UPI0031DF9FDD
MKKFKQQFVHITTWIAFGLAFLGYLMIRGAARHFDNFVSYIMLAAGIGFILFFAVMLLILIRMSKKTVAEETINQLQDMYDLVNQGIQIPVNLEQVAIKSNQWTETEFIPTNHYDIELKKEHIQSILEFEAEFNGGKHLFRMPSELAPKSLEMYFAMKQSTILYVDPANPARFYLDLSFIP